MSNSWFVLDDRGRMGPFTQSQIIETLKTFPNREEVLVKREGQKAWQRAGDFPELFSKPVDSQVVLPSPIIVPDRKIDQVIPFLPAKWRWAKNGAVIGVILGAIDLLLLLQPHTINVNSASYLVGFISGAAMIGAFVGFMAGAVRDFLSKSPPVQAPVRNVEAQPIASNRLNIVAIHWRGQYPLWVAYWVISMVGTVTASLLAVLIVAAFDPKSGYDPLASFATIASMWLCILAISVWQIVGVWRSANHQIAARASIGKKAPWAGVAKIAVIIGVIKLASVFLSSGLPQLSESIRIAFMGDPDIPEYSFRIMRNGTEVEIVGGFKYGLTDEFRKLLKASRQIRVVHLDSLGGRIGEAKKLNALIHEKGLTTYVPSRCASACTIAFAGGNERYIARGAILGFHGPAFPGMGKDELAISIRDQSQLFRLAGFSAAFIDRALNTPNSALWKPTVPELFAAKAITGLSDGTQFAASGFGEVTKEGMATMLAKALPLLETLKERMPKSYDSIVDAYYVSYVAGETEADAIAAARGKLMPVLNSLKPLADDDVLVNLARLYADEYQALGGKNPTLCYLYASGTDSKRNYTSEFPPSLVKRELELNDRVVRTAIRRPAIDSQTLDPIWTKLGVLLNVQGVTQENLDLLTKRTVAPTRYAEYCKASVGFFIAIAKLPERDSAALMRKILAEK